jgi:hypothetical protein
MAWYHYMQRKRCVVVVRDSLKSTQIWVKSYQILSSISTISIIGISQRSSSPITKNGAGMCCTWLHKPIVAGHLRHEGSHSRFPNGNYFSFYNFSLSHWILSLFSLSIRLIHLKFV